MPKLTQQQIRVLKRKFIATYEQRRNQSYDDYHKRRADNNKLYEQQAKLIRAEYDIAVEPLRAKIRALEAKVNKAYLVQDDKLKALRLKLFGPEVPRGRCGEEVWADVEFKLTFGDPQDEAAALKLIEDTITEVLK